MRLPKIINRPESPGEVSTEKAAAVAATAAILATAVSRLWPELDLPDDVFGGVAVILVSYVGWRGRQRRGEESAADSSPRVAKLYK